MFQLSKRTTVVALLALVWAMVVGLALQISPDPMLHLVQIPLVTGTDFRVGQHQFR